jgi:hypothetical protein
LLLCGVLLLTLGAKAHAAQQVLSPIIDVGEFDIELKADRTFDKNAERDNARGIAVDVGWGVNRHWATEIEGQWRADPGGNRHYSATSWENRFQLTPQGKYWVDVGLFVEYERAIEADEHNNITVGLLLQKETGQNLTTLNLLFNRELGQGGAPGLATEVRLQSRWRLSNALQPGFEVYLEPGRLGHFADWEEQRVRAGPVLVGMWHTGPLSKLKYELGYLAGLTAASERGTLRALLEFETRY